MILQKVVLENADLEWANKSQIMSNISLLHPIRKYRAYKAMLVAKEKYQIAKREYKIAKQDLKKSQNNLRTMRAEIRNQYKAVNKNEKMMRRFQKVQKEQFVTLPLQDVIEYNKQLKFYTNSKYHVDRCNLLSNYYISDPKNELYSNINKAYSQHLKEKAKAKLKNSKEKVMSKTRQIADKMKSNQPEIEV